MILPKLSHLLSFSAAAISIAPKMAAAQDITTLLNCIDLTSGALNDGCQCDDLVAFCSSDVTQFSDFIPGLVEMCEGVVSCCDGNGLTETVDYNVCWEGSGIAFPDLSDLLVPSVPVTTTDATSSSIADSFDTNAPTDSPVVGGQEGVPSVPVTTTNAPSSSIADSFDTNAPTDSPVIGGQEGVPSVPVTTTDAPSSSIADEPEATTNIPTTFSTKAPVGNAQEGLPSEPEANTSVPTTSTTKAPVVDAVPESTTFSTEDPTPTTSSVTPAPTLSPTAVVEAVNAPDNGAATVGVAVAAFAVAGVMILV